MAPKDTSALASATAGAAKAAPFAALIAIWYVVSSVAVVLVWQLSDGTGKWGAVLEAVGDFTFAQLAATAVGASTALMLTGGATATEQGRGYVPADVLPLLAVAAFHSLGTAAANWCTVAVGPSTSQIVKLLEPLVTVLLARVLLGTLASARVWAAVGLTSVGVYVSTSAHISHLTESATRSPTWLAALLITVTAFPASNVVSKWLPTSGLRLTRDLSALGAAALLPVQLYAFGLRGGRACAAARAAPATFIAMVASQAIYRVMSFKVLAQTTPVMHAQLRMGKRLASVATSLLLFHDIDFRGETLLGLLSTTTGLVWYAAIERSRRRKEAASASRGGGEASSGTAADMGGSEPPSEVRVLLGGEQVDAKTGPAPACRPVWWGLAKSLCALCIMLLHYLGICVLSLAHHMYVRLE